MHPDGWNVNEQPGQWQCGVILQNGYPCTGQVFWLYDGGAGPNGSMHLVRKCKLCKSEQAFKVQPVMVGNEERSAHQVPPAPGLPQNLLVCGALHHPTPQEQDGICRGVEFRVLNREGDLFTRCEACGTNEPFGFTTQDTWHVRSHHLPGR